MHIYIYNICIYIYMYIYAFNSKCMSCHKAIVVITGRAHCFYDYIYYAHLAFVRFEHSACRGLLMTTIYA